MQATLAVRQGVPPPEPPIFGRWERHLHTLKHSTPQTKRWLFTISTPKSYQEVMDSQPPKLLPIVLLKKIYDERTGQTFNYTRKKGVYATEILTPHNAPDWTRDRSTLWNAAELRRINEAVIESNRQADENRQRLQDLSNRLRNDSSKIRKSRKSTQQKRPTPSSKTPKSSEPFKPQDKRTQRKLSSHLEGSTVRETGNKKTPRQRDNVPTPNPSKIDSTDSDNLQSRNLDVNQTPSPQQPPTGQDQRTGQQHRNQTQTPSKRKSLIPEHRPEDVPHLATMTTIIRLMRYVKPKPKNGLQTYEGKRCLLRPYDCNQHGNGKSQP